ncbi:TRAP transporter small permease [Martelella soudanensis]|uniref:TRAP transporter small permease n=1 Tax=unclassified Martelella TaxID=2629616 RepID=UPI0015DE8982|nr:MULTISPECIES: TRAP transporter small permease subunit [unclassified Martelella]
MTRLEWLSGMSAKALFAVSGAAMVLIAMIGFSDVVASFLFRAPLKGVFEATELLLVVLIFLAQPFAVFARGHVALDLLDFAHGSFGARVRMLLIVVTGALCYGVLVRSSYASFIASYQIQEISQGLVKLPVYPAKFAVFLGSVLALVQVLVLPFRPEPDSQETHISEIV